MGWLFRSNTTRQDIVDELIRFEENEHGIWETLRHSLRGNVLWSIVLWTEKKSGVSRKVICCHLLEGSGHSWGYKSMDEAMGPYYYTCPISYFKDVPVACQKWRDEVKKHHLKKNRKFLIGDKLLLTEDCKVPFVIVIQVSPLVGTYGDMNYRINRKYVIEVERKTKAA